MTATDELRRMLDEAGVEWDYGITGAASTMFNANGVELTFIDMRDGVTCSTILTPEQAIAATGWRHVTPRLSVTARHVADLLAENQKLRELLDYALPIAMYAASTEEGDRIRELMREVDG